MDTLGSEGTPRLSSPDGYHLNSLAAVVGIGASAGGLEALEVLFDSMPPHTGLAFVVVQHLSPDFKSLMDELLSRHTKIAIHRVTDGMLVEPNAIYLIPPKKEMIMSGGRLLLTDKDPTRGLNLPIDIFFRSLAQDAGRRAIAVVLSGTGSDGSRGICAVHETGGVVIVQDPDTAKFDGMPRSAIDTGIVDFVVSPERIPHMILSHISQHDVAVGDAPVRSVSEEGMNAIFRLLRDEYGIDFSHYKPSTVSRRIERRLQMNQALDLEDYVRQLREDPHETNLLYKDLLIGVTEFFRDEEAFERLEKEVIPQILDRVRPEDGIRAWVAGCATGEEAYSLAICIDEALELRGMSMDVKIFATDVHRTSLEHASNGIYEEASLAHVSPRRRERYFLRRGRQFQVSQDLRKRIVFAPHNVMRDAPFTKLDLVSCRNMLIYFESTAQKKVLSLFHFGLNTGGFMFLGPSEHPGEIGDEFDVIDPHWKIYRKRRDVRLSPHLRIHLSPNYVTARPAPAPPPGYPDLDLLRAYDALLEEYAPPSVLLDSHRQIIHTFGGAGRLLRPSDGRMSTDILEMVDRELRLVLAGALQRALREHTPVTYTGTRVMTSEGQEELRIRVKPLDARHTREPFLLVSFESVAPLPQPDGHSETVDVNKASRDQMQSLEVELRYTKENLQATIEELETSNEELQATNEELVASNEELQSTNEELHSVNEELYTVNAEHQRKITQLTQLTDDMDNLLASTDVGTIFLDRSLCIRKFTPRVTEVFHILAQDMGRRIDSFASSIDYLNLVPDAERVLRGEAVEERQVQNHKGTWYLLRVLPYRTGRQIDGVVVTFIGIDALKETERELRHMSKVFMDAADPIIIEDLHGVIADVNEEAVRSYGWSREELLGSSIELLMPESERMRAWELRKRCRNNEPVRNLESRRVCKSGEIAPVLLTLSLITNDEGQPVAIASIAKDLSAQKQAETIAREAVERRDQFLAMLSHELRNPLGAVLNATYVLDDNCSVRASCKSPCLVIQRQTHQMSRLLDDLLDVTRVTQGKIEMRPQPVNFRETIDNTLDALCGELRERRQDLELDIDPQPMIVYGDATRLQQIQVNLLTNAMKYTPPGGRIWLSAHPELDDIVFRVRDDGVGIPPDMLQRVFDLFVQARSTLDRSDGGMGVGLTLVKQLVEMHGGSVSAHSDGVGQGSEFVVRLPAYRGEPRHQTSHATPSRKEQQTGRILVVEDNADSREMLKSLLEIYGYSVEAVPDGHAGLDMLQQREFDLALVDIGLPGIDGYEVARTVRLDPRHQSLRLVALTGYGAARDREAVKAAGFDDHLVKPLRREDLVRVLPRTGGDAEE